MKFFIKRLCADTLQTATFLVCDHIYDETGVPANYERTRQFLDSCDAIHGAVFVACANKHVVGVVVGLIDQFGAHYEVRNLYVDEQYRGSNCAQLLLAALLDWAGDKDAPVYIATTGPPRAFYRKLGFEPTHIVSRASLKTLRERIGGKDGKRTSADPCGDRGPGPDERGEERAEAGGPV